MDPSHDLARRRGVARLGAVQALYQQAMTSAPLAPLIAEFHNHRLRSAADSATGSDAAEAAEAPETDAETALPEADIPFFDDIVSGAHARAEELDTLVAAALAPGWTLERLDRPMRALLRLATYEIVARPDVSAASAIDSYVEVAHAFFDERQVGFVNGLLDTVARTVRG
jgi:N utilization substance protein B